MVRRQNSRNKMKASERFQAVYDARVFIKLYK